MKQRSRFRPLRVAAAVAGAMTLALGLASCAGAASAAGGTVTLTDDTVIIDVRTPEEFTSGHLEGAELLDFNGGQLSAAIPSLDPAAEYVVYCRSGNRSGQAVALMEQAGFTNVTNLGSLEQAASATSIEIVTP